MDQKQVTITVVVSLLTALVVSVLVVGLSSQQYVQTATNEPLVLLTPGNCTNCTLPDLIVSNVSISVTNGTTNSSNYTILITPTVTNIGQKTADVSRTRVGIIGYKGISLSTPSLAPGKSATLVPVRYSLPEGSYFQFAIADINNVVEELNENNNQNNRVFEVP